ncbi:MAG: ribonuclease BN [Salinigranum sp.]
MTSLSEVYGGEGGADLRRLYLGVGLFLAGSLLVVAGIVVATTDVLGGATLAQARELGGVLGGTGVPLVFLGILTVLPASRRVRGAAVIGTAVAFLGVGLFSHAYPCQWSGSNCGAGLVDLTLPTVGIYFLGTITTFWCLFAGVANFKTRNDPGGTVRMEITKRGETRVVEVPRSAGGLGGIGLFGERPDGEVETQTNRRKPPASPSPQPASQTVSDGGASTQDIRSPLDDGPGSASARSDAVGDNYCGNCAHFDYVRTSDGIQPYCGMADELMDDMDPCEEWTSRT